MKTKKILASLLLAGIALSLGACSKADPTIETTTATTVALESTTLESTVSFDPSSIDWESIYEWNGNTIVGFSTLPEGLMEYGIIVIPARCEVISPQAFSYNEWVTAIEFENQANIQSIGHDAFYFVNMESFACPDALIYQDGDVSDDYIIFRDSTSNIHNFVAPNGMTDIQLLYNMGDIQTQLGNQMKLENLYLPENFELHSPYWNTFEDRYRVVAKYTEEWFNSSGYFQLNTFSDYSTSTLSEFPTEPLKVYVVEGSWADVNFDDYFVGDLIQKEYWDGVTAY